MELDQKHRVSPTCMHLLPVTDLEKPTLWLLYLRARPQENQTPEKMWAKNNFQCILPTHKLYSVLIPLNAPFKKKKWERSLKKLWILVF